MQKYSAVIIAILVFLISCGHAKDPAGKLWFYTHSTGTKNPADSALTPASFIDLENDGSFTSDFGQFDYGKWVYDGHQILFTNYQHNKSILPVSYLTGNEMQTGPAKGPFNNFESLPLSFASTAENPFSKENNLWRIKASSRESDLQIKSRLLNHLRFWELYFTWAFNDNVQYIDVRSTPTPLKIYGNGFGLKPFDDLPATWKSYFFDEEDCKKANAEIKTLFDRHAIAWPHTESKYKMFMSAFQQMQQKLQ